jgi:hypothetical protein
MDLGCIMGKIKLNRITMTKLLFSLKGLESRTPLQIITDCVQPVHIEDIPEFILKFERKKNKKEYGLSTNEIVALGNLCELTSFKSTSIQNWIKRDVKELIGSPELGKKYSVEQAALLLIVRDLKAVFDFETICRLLMKVFNTLSDRSDDLINPLRFYQIYAITLENLGNIMIEPSCQDPLEEKIEKEIYSLLQEEMNLQHIEVKEITHILVITVLAVLSSHIQLRTIQYAEKAFTT